MTFAPGTTIRLLSTNQRGVVMLSAWWGDEEHVQVNTAPPDKPEKRRVWRVADCARVEEYA